MRKQQAFRERNRNSDTSNPRPRARDVVAELPGEELRTEVLGLTQRLASGTYELLVLVGELDARGTWATWGALSCAAWLADTRDVEVATARTQVRVARALREYPTLDAAMRDGDVSYAKARVLVPYLTDANIDALVRIAATTPSPTCSPTHSFLFSSTMVNDNPSTPAPDDASPPDDNAECWTKPTTDANTPADSIPMTVTPPGQHGWMRYRIPSSPSVARSMQALPRTVRGPGHPGSTGRWCSPCELTN